MLLPEFIDKVGVERLAATLSVTTATIYNWRRLENPVPVLLAYKMIILSFHILTWDDIYKPYIEFRLKSAGVDPSKIDMLSDLPF